MLHRKKKDGWEEESNLVDAVVMEENTKSREVGPLLKRHRIKDSKRILPCI